MVLATMSEAAAFSAVLDMLGWAHAKEGDKALNFAEALPPRCPLRLESSSLATCRCLTSAAESPRFALSWIALQPQANPRGKSLRDSFFPLLADLALRLGPDSESSGKKSVQKI